MKYSKKMRVLRGVTNIRVRMGITQLALAQYLGLSENMISMVENGKRRLSEAALLKICELEIYFSQQQQQGKLDAISLPAYRESELERAIREAREENNRLRLKELQYKIAYTKQRYSEILGSLQELDTILEFVGQHAAPFALASMVQSREKLLKQLKRFDLQAQAKLEGKIKMLEIIIASYEPRATEEPDQNIMEVTVVKDEEAAIVCQGQSAPITKPLKAMSLHDRMVLFYPGLAQNYFGMEFNRRENRSITQSAQSRKHSSFSAVKKNLKNYSQFFLSHLSSGPH